MDIVTTSDSCKGNLGEGMVMVVREAEVERRGINCLRVRGFVWRQERLPLAMWCSG